MQVVDASGNMFGYDSITVAGPDGKPKTLSSAIKLITLVRNTSGSTMTKGTVVYINGGSGNKPTIARALATSDATSAQTYGVVQSNIPNNKNGYVVVTGALEGVNTSAYAPGTQLYLSSTVAGEWTSVKQLAPNHLVYVGIVVRQHVNQGVVEVKIQNGYELDEIHDVSITTPLNNQVLQYESSTQLWKNKTISTGITIGSTAIASGVVGRVLFEGAGNVVQESSSLFWDNTNQQLQVNTNNTVSAQRGLSVTQFGDFIGGAPMSFNKARGTIASPTNVNANDLVGAFTFNPRVGGAYTLDRALFGANMATSTGLGLYFIAGSSDGNYIPSLYLHPSGNAIFGTSQSILTGITDTGFKVDIAGTARVRNTLSISNPSFTMGGSITHSANATLVITGGPGAGGENITFGPSNRIFINAQQSRFPTGSVQIAGTLSVGNQNATSTNMLLLGGSITAGSALGRGIGMDTTLVASANNDVLIGLDVLPTFTNGAFTGVSNFAARFGGDVVFTSGNRNIRVLSPPTTGNGGSIVIAAGNATTSGTGGSITLSEGLGAGGPGRGSINIGTAGYTTVNIGGANVTVTNSGPNTGTAFTVLAGGQNGLAIYWDNLTPFMQYGLVSGRQSRFVNSTSYTFSSKVFINTNTDAGYNFDVNGTARISGIVTIGDNVQGKISADNQYLNLYHNGGTLSILSFGFGSSIGASGYLRINQNAGDPSGTNSGTIHRYDFNSTITNSTGTAQWNFQSLRPNYNFTGTYSGTVRGFYYNPTLTSMIGVTHFAFHSTSGRVRFENLPTSSAGLSSGELWNDAGTLKIV